MRRVLLISLIFGAMTMIASAFGSRAAVAAPGKEMSVNDCRGFVRATRDPIRGQLRRAPGALTRIRAHSRAANGRG